MTAAMAFRGGSRRGNQCNVNLGTVDGAQPAVTQYIGSAGVGPYEFLPAGTTSFDSLTNAGIRTNLSSLGFKLMRIHVGNESTIMSATFPDASHNTYATATWTQFDSLFASLPSICNLATTRLLLTGGVAPSWMTSTNAVTTLNGATQYGVMMVAIATRAVFRATEIFYWEPYNEPNSKMTAAQYGVLHNQVASQLKTYATGTRSTTYFVGGPCIDQVPFSTWIANMITAAGKANVDFLSWHDYPYGSGRTPFNSSNGVTWVQYVTDATTTRSGTAATAVTQARGADATIPTTIPCCMTEWNMNYNSGTGTTTADGEVWQSDYRGAVWAALYIWTMLTQQSGANMTMMALYEAVGDSRFGVVRSTTVAAASIDPQGYFLKAFTALMPGSQVTYASVGTLTNLAVLATVNGSVYGVMFINYDAATSYTLTANLQGLAVGATLTYTEISSANPTTLTSTIDRTALAALVIPAQSIVFLSP